MRRVSQLLLHVGIPTVVLALGKAHATLNSYDLTSSERFAFALGFIGLLSLAAYGAGLPDLVAPRRQMFSSAVKAVAAAVLVVSIVQLFVGDGLLPRFVVFGSAVVLAPWFVVTAALSARARARAAARDRILLIGQDETRKALEEDLQMRPERPATLVAFLGTEDLAQRPQLIDETASESRAAVIVLDRSALAEESIVARVAAAHLAGARVRSLTAFYEEWLGKLPVAELERAALMFDISELHRSRYQRTKRLFDIAVAALGLLPLALAWPAVAVANRVVLRIPTTFRQTRVGKDGREFEIVKFRTMRAGPEGRPDEWTTNLDPRITPFGRFLRRSHIDELPQVLNILRGHTSIVGPRPEQPHYVEALTRVLPFYALRSTVMPGLTGWAQVKFGYAGSERDALQKLQYDFYYLRHQGLRMDLIVLGRTMRDILGLGGR